MLNPVCDFLAKLANRGLVIVSTFCRTVALIVLDSTSYYRTPLATPLPDFDVLAVVAETPRLVLEINIDDDLFISLPSFKLPVLDCPNSPG